MRGLEKLVLRRFRNYDELDLPLYPGGLHVIHGENGQGKSNFLEALYYLALLRSFRTRQVSQCQTFGSDWFYIQGLLRDDSAFQGKTVLEVGYGSQRRLKVNSADVRRASEFINQYICIGLVPEDIELVQGPAGIRRRFLDIALSQLNSQYIYHLQRFVYALKLRNLVLRQAHKFNDRLVGAYDEQLIKHGVYLAVARRAFIDCLQAELIKLGPALHPLSSPDFKVVYRSQMVGTTEHEAETSYRETNRGVLCLA